MVPPVRRIQLPAGFQRLCPGSFKAGLEESDDEHDPAAGGLAPRSLPIMRWMAFEPRWFRVVNIVMHLVNGWLVFVILRRLGTGMATRGWMTGKSAMSSSRDDHGAGVCGASAGDGVGDLHRRGFTSMGTLLLLLWWICTCGR